MKPLPDKWLGAEFHFKEPSRKVIKAEDQYADLVTRHDETTTRQQAKQEFWERLAEYYGFKIMKPIQEQNILGITEPQELWGDPE